MIGIGIVEFEGMTSTLAQPCVDTCHLRLTGLWGACRQVAAGAGNAGPRHGRVRAHGEHAGIPSRGHVPLLEHALEDV